MSIMVTDGRSGVIPARFDEVAFEAERERIAAAQATLAEARELAELSDEQREAIAADIAERRARPALAAPRERWRVPSSNGLGDASPPPGAFERSLEEVVQRRVGTVDAQLEAISSALSDMMECVEQAHTRIDRLEHDNLQLRALLHENSLGLRSLLPNPNDDLAPRIPGVLARAGSRSLTERPGNRSWPATDSAPWFSSPVFTDDPS